MDTPERTQIGGTPKPKFEDSPVFNYLNNLSPIKPVKSGHFTQTFSSLSFTSLPSVFTTPHASSHKESRFLKKHNGSDDPCKPEFSLESGDKVCTSGDAVQLYNNSSKIQEDCAPVVPTGEAFPEPSSEQSKFVIELPRNLNYDCGSPDGNTSHCVVIQEYSDPELSQFSASIAHYAQETSDKDKPDDEPQQQVTCQSEQRREGTCCDWESLVSDAADILIFDSPSSTDVFKELMNHSLDSITRLSTSIMPHNPQDNIGDEQLVQLNDTSGSGRQIKIDDHSSQRGEASDLNETEHMPNHQYMVNNPIDQADNRAEKTMQLTPKSGMNLHRGLRRRCLDFEMTGARRKGYNDVSEYGSSLLSQSNETFSASDKQLISTKPGGESSRCILPGIGLHLNALATTSKDYKLIKNESSASDRDLGLPNSNASLHSPTAGQGSAYEPFSSAPTERDMDGTENGVQQLKVPSQTSTLLANEELNQNSPKKKRRRTEHTGEAESCKRCNCKKSKCLKLYCECFAAGVYCIEPCSCQDCFNKPIHEDTVLETRKQIESRNPLAFAPKVIRNSDSAAPEYGDESSKTPASARHKRGCNCKKSNCLKKYCECYQGGVGCSVGCRCEGCKNAFGTKEGSVIGTETELEEETEAAVKSVADRDQRKNEIQKHEEQISALPITPSRLSRQLVPVSFSSKSKPPRSSVFSIGGSSSGLYASQKLRKSNILQPQSKFDQRNSQTVQKDEMSDILQGDCSPTTGVVKTSSPNSKRVSPPCTFRPSPGRRSGRKLILQSIPSFPSLTPHH